MADPPRSESLPALNESDDGNNLINPAYSGSVAEGVRYSASGEEPRVEFGMDSTKPAPETASMTRIKVAVIILFVLIGVVLAFEITQFVYSIGNLPVVTETEAESVSQEDLEAVFDVAILAAPWNETSEDITTEMPTTTSIPSTTTTTEETTTSTTTTSTTTEPPTTTLSPRELLRAAYLNYTVKFNRTFSEEGLDNYEVNEWFVGSSETVEFGETQFSDLSEKQLKKLVNSERDPKESDTSKRCDIHSYHGGAKQEDHITGSALYGSHDRIPSRVDLRRRGIIGAVRNQGTKCNAGYAFSVASILESKVDTNCSRLSVQMLLADEYNHHCEGGETFRALESLHPDGIVTEDVLPYDETQHWHYVDANATVYGFARACVIVGHHREANSYRDPHNHYNWIQVAASSVQASTYIKHFLAQKGTVIVEVPVEHAFFFYKSGLIVKQLLATNQQ